MVIRYVGYCRTKKWRLTIPSSDEEEDGRTGVEITPKIVYVPVHGLLWILLIYLLTGAAVAQGPALRLLPRPRPLCECSN